MRAGRCTECGVLFLHVPERGRVPARCVKHRAMRQRAQINAWHAEHGRGVLSTEQKRVIHRRHRYGMEPDEYAARWVAQDGRCAICGDELVRPHVDHDHATGDNRGLLCQQCNHGLGNFADDPERLRKAALYLERQSVAAQ